MNQPGSGGSPLNVHLNVGSKSTPSTAADRLHRSPLPTYLPYVRQPENQAVKRPPVYTSTPFMTNTTPKPDYEGLSALSRVIGLPSAGIQPRRGPNLDRPLPQADSSSSLPTASVTGPGASEPSSGNPALSSSHR